MRNICVFASSSTKLDQSYSKAAKELGQRIAQKGLGIVFGAGTDGLMGELARGAAQHGASIIGVIPDSLNVKGVVYEHCSELIDTRTMHERKAIMAQRADAFIALPGGFGTLEEILEIITLKQLGYHNKPIAILNTNGFYTHLIAQLNETVNQRFATRQTLQLFGVFDTIQDVLDYIENDVPQSSYSKHTNLE